MIKSLDIYSHFYNSIINSTITDDSIRICVRIDSNYHTYLKEHIFGTVFFVPATFIIELMCEASLYYYENVPKEDIEDIHISSISELEILRGLKRNPGESIDIVIEVSKYTNEICCIKIFSERRNLNNVCIGMMLNVRGFVRITKTDSIHSIKFQAPQLIGNTYSISKELLYERYFPGLGEHFQTCSEKFLISKDKRYLMATYNCKNGEESCIQGISSSFITSTLGNDACFQMAVLLSRLNNGLGRLPTGSRYIRFYRKQSLVDDINVYVRINEIDENKTLYHIVAYDKDGICVEFCDAITGKSPYQRFLNVNEEEEFLINLN